jgi:plasmid stabilization system protein ParE
MELKILWTDFAILQLSEIFNYYENRVSLNVAQNLLLGIQGSVNKLQQYLNIGQVEPQLANNSKPIRYVIYKAYKILYLVNKKNKWIEIWDVFDTRQNPITIERNK